MPISDPDILREAQMMIREHGVEAELEACRMADRFLGWGDRDGQLRWLRIRNAIRELEAGPSGMPN
jgi:hypothetical protein